MKSIGCALLLLLSVVSRAQATDPGRDDALSCPGSKPEPARSAMWDVAFCNRTTHDLVLQFRDNDCPVQQGAHRGDVYERTLPRGQSATFPLCFADQSHIATPPPGVPMLRIPGGKGIVTTWSVVGDCGERSGPLYLDARTFYDRGDYATGIVLLQYPAGAPHCAVNASSAAAGTRDAAAAQAMSSTAVPAPSSPAPSAPAPALRPSVAPAPARVPPVAPAPSPPPASPSAALPSTQSAPAVDTTESVAPGSFAAGAPGSSAPALRAQIDIQDPLRRTIRIFATGAARGQENYECRLGLSLSFADGGSFDDRFRAQVPATARDALVATRKYFKSVSSVTLEKASCTAR